MRLFITLFICSYLQSTTDEYFKKPINFDADIIINNQENFISKGKILFRDGSFIYNADKKEFEQHWRFDEWATNEGIYWGGLIYVKSKQELLLFGGWRDSYGSFHEYRRQSVTANKHRYSDCNGESLTFIAPEYKCCRASYWLSNDTHLAIQIWCKLPVC